MSSAVSSKEPLLYPYRDGDSEQPLSSTQRAFTNLIRVIIGTGVLGLPYTFSRSGWLLGSISLALGGAFSYRGMMLIIHSKHMFISIHPDISVLSYGDLMFYTYGKGARLLVDVLLSLGTIACGMAYLTFITQNLSSVASAIESNRFFSSRLLSLQDSSFSLFRDVLYRDPIYGRSIELSDIWTSKYLYACIFFVIGVVLSVIPSVTHLAPLSTVANVTNFTALAAVMVLEIMAATTAGGFQHMNMMGSLSTVLSTFGVAVYAFQAAGVMIPIETSMAEPWKLGSVLRFACAICAAIYAGFSVLGYATFGEDTQQIITLSLEDGTVALLIKTGLCLSLFITLPLLLNPMYELTERRFANGKRSLLLRALLVFAIFLLGLEVKRFADFLSLAGSSIACLLGFIIPAAVHLKVLRECDKGLSVRGQIISDYCVITVGLLLAVSGTYISFNSLFSS